MRNGFLFLVVPLLVSCSSSVNNSAELCTFDEEPVSAANASPIPVDQVEAEIAAQTQFQVLWTPIQQDDMPVGTPRQTAVSVEWTRLPTPPTVAQRGSRIVEVDGEEVLIPEYCVEGEFLRLEYEVRVTPWDNGFEALGTTVVQVEANGAMLLMTDGLLDQDVDLSTDWVEGSPLPPDFGDHQAWRVGFSGRPELPRFSIDGIYTVGDDGTESAVGLWRGSVMEEQPGED